MSAQDRTHVLSAFARRIASKYSAKAPASNVELEPAVAVSQPNETNPPPPATTWVSLALKMSGECTVVEILVARLADFLNDVGAAALEANLVDVQFWLQRREARKQKEPEIWGVVIDVDVSSPDPFGAFVDAMPIPTAWWRTMHGSKAALVFDRAVSRTEFVAIAEQLTLAIAGGDPNSWSVDQAQHLPIVNKTTLDGLVPVKCPGAQTNGRPLVVDEFATELPIRLERALSTGTRITTGERHSVEEYLCELGLPSPADISSRSGPYSCCPASASHDSACCYVIKAKDGSLRVVCYGGYRGHNGRAETSWSERELLDLASGVERRDDGIAVMRDLPVTWVGEDYARLKFSALFADEDRPQVFVEAAVRVWLRARAFRALRSIEDLARKEGAENLNTKSLADIVWFYQRRIGGFDDTGPCRLGFDNMAGQLRIVRSNGAVEPVTTKGESLALKPHLHEWKTSTAFDLRAEVSFEKDGGKMLTTGFTIDTDGFDSHWNKALGGSLAHLRALGLPAVDNYIFPVAHTADDIAFDASTKCMIVTRTARLHDVDAGFDALDFFAKLQREGKLPLATEADVPRLLMALASPLIRRIAPGLLGVYVFEGPSGAGKEYVITVISDTWGHTISTPRAVYYEIHKVDDLEQNRNFHAAADSALYLRAIEAGKSMEKIDSLIRYSTSRYVTARGMRMDARQILNGFTYLADTVEGLPERREISRRTTVIGMRPMADAMSKGEIRDQVIKNASNIVGYLKRRVETESPNWYLNQAFTKSRQVGQVALARLFGASLPEVVGTNMDEFFEALLAYIDIGVEDIGKKELANALARGTKDGREATTFSSYPLSHLIDQMQGQVGYKQLFSQFKSKRMIKIFLNREKDYAEVDNERLPYLPVSIHGKRYAFKLIKDDRNFVLEQEMIYCNRLGIPSITGQTTEETPNAAESAPARPPATATTNRSSLRVSAAAMHARDRARAREEGTDDAVESE